MKKSWGTVSPNLNPIERLWKVMNENVRNNQFFESAKVFIKSILNFFEITWPKIASSMTSCINDNFILIGAVKAMSMEASSEIML